MKTLLLASLFAAGTALAAEPRPQDRWNLADMYADDAAWNGDVAKVETQLKDFSTCSGKLGSSAKRLRECLDLYYDIAKRVTRLGVYAGEAESDDTGDAANQSRNQKAQVISTRFGEVTAFLN